MVKMERIEQKLNNFTSENNVNDDVYQKVNLNSSEKMLPVGDINKVLNINEQFNKERTSSTKYRIISTIRPLISNVLMNSSGLNSLSSFFNDSFRVDNLRDNDVLNLRDSLSKHLKEINGWFVYEEPILVSGKLCKYIDVEPSRDKFTYISKEQNNNWDYSVTYPYESVSNIGDITYNGLLITDKQTVMVGGRVMTAFGVPVKHNLKAGSTVRLKNINNALNGDYLVFRVGLDNGDLPDNYFCVNITPEDIPTLSNNVRMVRMVGLEESKYYYRKFKKINMLGGDLIDTSDVDMYNLGFSQNFYEDKVEQLVFSGDIDVSGLVDNLNRPLSEVFITLIKNKDHNNVPFFSNLKSGLDLDLISGIEDDTNIPDIRRIHNGGNLPFISHNSLETDITIDDNIFYGDVVEYNRLELNEVVLSEVRHRFNTLDRELETIISTTRGETINMGVRQEGYLYKPFHRVKIRDFSNYIEQGDEFTVGIPDYFEDLGDGRILWRDLLDIGVNDVNVNPVNFPFLNGSHYVHLNICNVLERQDPFGNYDLYYSEFPRDPFGDRINRIFETKRRNEEI